MSGGSLFYEPKRDPFWLRALSPLMRFSWTVIGWLWYGGFLAVDEGAHWSWRDLTVHPIREWRRRLAVANARAECVYLRGFKDGHAAGERVTRLDIERRRRHRAHWDLKA